MNVVMFAFIHTVKIAKITYTIAKFCNFKIYRF